MKVNCTRCPHDISTKKPEVPFGPNLPFVMARQAAVQLPQSCHWRGSAAISGCDERSADKTTVQFLAFADKAFFRACSSDLLAVQPISPKPTFRESWISNRNSNFGVLISHSSMLTFLLKNPNPFG
jgi:hypothetical protein